MNADMALTPYQPQQMGALRPIVEPHEMVQAIKEYEALKAAIIQKTDVQKIGDKQHIKKSGWLRIARAFGVTVEPVSEQFERADDGTWGYAIVVRAVAPNGASMQGDGMCWSTEKAEKQRTRHNVRAHAYTRATNRAISNLVGGGEVSAEELQDFRDDDDDYATPTPRQQLAPRIHEQPRRRPGNWSACRVIGNQLGWTQDEYETKLYSLLGKKAADQYTPSEFTAWANYLQDKLDEKRETDGELTPDPDQPHDLRKADIPLGMGA